MTQDERWYTQWKEVMEFLEANKRRPSKFVDVECSMQNRRKHQQKILNAGELKEDRIKLFKQLLEMGEKYKRKNQYE